jgi:hypothetical protein
MNAADATVVIDEKKVREILASFALPKEIENVEVKFGSDSTGDPSVSLTFVVRDKILIGPEEMRRLTDFLSEVTRAMLQGNIGGFAYTKLAQAA